MSCTKLYKKQIICGFPGIGKSYLAKKLNLNDSDSSKFDKKEFPKNYVDYIERQEGVILSSSHKEVRDELKKRGLEFTVFIPSLDCKNEYLSRYKKRGSNKDFINLLNASWSDWIIDCMSEKNIKILKPKEYLEDVLKLTNLSKIK